jgi:hypothetical protein
MSSEIDGVEDFVSNFEATDNRLPNIATSNNVEESSYLKEKFKQSSDSRKRLEEKLEQSKIDREVKDFNYDDFDD